MHGKEFMLDVIRTYFAVVTLINVVMFILGNYIAPENRFGYDAFATPLIYGAAGTLPNIMMYSKKELGVKELIFRKVLQFILIEIIVLFVAFYNQSDEWTQPGIIFAVAVSVLVIYVISSLIDWLQNLVSARKMTEDLVRFQESVKG